MVSAASLISFAAVRLDSRFDANQLMGMALGVDAQTLSLRLREELSPDEISAFEALVSRRERGEPLQYILGEWEFYGMKFYVGSGVLIPRQDTETLVDCVLERCGGEPRILELGAGSGCVCCTLKKMIPSAEVIAVEKSPQAFFYLKKNISYHALEINAVLGDALDPASCAVSGRFDIILSNPPYLTASDMGELQREIRFEPEGALYGGNDGLDFYRGFTRAWAERLAPGGSFFYEAGFGQAEDIIRILAYNGLGRTEVFRDAAGKWRVVRGMV